MLFMTDGHGSYTTGTMESISRTYGSRFDCHTVGFGGGVNKQLLESMTAGKGKYHQANSGIDLIRTFAAIASDSNSANELAHGLVKNIMDSAVDTLILDYL